MEYPMTYERFVWRNRLHGTYRHGLLAGDMRRMEADQLDDAHLSAYAARAHVSPDQARVVLEMFFGGAQALLGYQKGTD